MRLAAGPETAGLLVEPRLAHGVALHEEDVIVRRVHQRHGVAVSDEALARRLVRLVGAQPVRQETVDEPPGVVVALRRADGAPLRDRRLLVRGRHRDLPAQPRVRELRERGGPRCGVRQDARIDHRAARPRGERDPGVVRGPQPLVVAASDLGAVRLEDPGLAHRLDRDLAVRHEHIRTRIAALVEQAPLDIEVVDHLDLHLRIGISLEQPVDRPEVRPVAAGVDPQDPIGHQARAASGRFASAFWYRFHGSRRYSPSHGVPAASQ